MQLLRKLIHYRKRKIWLKEEEQDTFIPIADNIHKYFTPKILDEEEQLLFHNFKFLIPVYHKSQAIAFVLFGNMNSNSFFNETELLEFAQVITNIIAVALENKRLFKQEIEKKEYEKCLVQLLFSIAYQNLFKKNAIYNTV